MRTAKELRAEYEQIKPQIGVFQIRNKQNGKVLISGSTDLRSVWNSQKIKLEIGQHPNAALQKDWKESGSSNFSFEILEELTYTDDPAVDLKKEVRTLEEMLVEELQPFGDKGYNQTLK